MVFSGVGKTAGEMRQALQAGILCFNVESAPAITPSSARARVDRAATTTNTPPKTTDRIRFDDMVPLLIQRQVYSLDITSAEARDGSTGF